ncbi:unnamed protein product [Rhizophagus irregularis]|nr:unnamed protein product [Rhizophagus irregularis]
MSRQHEYPTVLLAKGIISPELHYGIFARNWWFQKASKNKQMRFAQQLIISYRLHMHVSCELNGENFIISIVQNTTSPFEPVSNIGYSKNNGCRGAGNGFTSSLLTKFQGKYSFISQQIKNNTCILRIYHGSKIVAQYEDKTPTGVWKTILQNPPQNKILRICTPDEWNNFEILQKAFDRYIKPRKIGTTALLNWQSFFIDWLSQESTIIQIPKTLQNIYPVDYQLQHKELCAWKAMLIACGCTNVTPFEKKKSDIEFWSRALDPTADKETLLNLYNAGLICLGNNSPIIIDKTEKFRYDDLRENLRVGSSSINLARKYARINGPGAPVIVKPKRKICRMSEIKEREFQLFFQDKSNVTMSSYKVDPKTNLPILYLQDQKKALWTKFEEIYPNEMKKTSFMARLADCSHLKYREDLGGLCLICNDYGFEAFQNLIAIARSTFNDKKVLDGVISRIEKLRMHMKRNFERELVINQNGTVSHDECINHCLLYAFGECNYYHTSRCADCDELFVFFDFLNTCVSSEQKTNLDQIKEQLKYYLSHQARKVYLNTQFKSSLAQLDEDGAIIVADYKMRILPKSARETKEQFFGKRGWTLHTILIFTKKDGTKLDVRAYDHWSTDTKQDAWFTASSFEAVFESIERKPKWIRIISDNGPHYHNSELMSIIAHWYDWYQIQVRSWLFLEPGKAKTTIDSHHASISHAIKRYVRIGYDIKGGQDIVEAGKNLAGTYFANIEPNRNENSENFEQTSNNARKKKKPKVKTIPGISKYFYWEWPVEGPLAGFIQARSLPHIGSWTRFSPAEISDLYDGSIVQPQPTVSTHTQASSNWTMPMPQLNVDVSDDVLDFTDQLDHRNITNRNQNSQHPNTNLVDKDFQLPKGWALKENQVFGGKGSGKRMTKKVKSLLERFFLNGNINLQDKLTAQGMRDELLKYVESEEIEEQDVPKVSTIQGWISRYAAALKHQATEAALSK